MSVTTVGSALQGSSPRRAEIKTIDDVTDFIDGIIDDALADAADLFRRHGATDAEVAAEMELQRARLSAWREKTLADLRAREARGFGSLH